MGQPLRRAWCVLLSLAACGPGGAAGLPVQQGPAAAEPAVLQLRVLEGEGAVFAVGSRSSRPLVVQVSDEVGRPVAGVAVSFRLPDEDPTGLFASGLKTEIQASGADGRASVWGVQWGKAPGPVLLRITAARGRARAGMVMSLYLTDSPAAIRSLEKGPGGGASRTKWFLLGLAAAGATGAAYALRPSQTPAATAAGLAAPVALVEVGPPSITIGKP